MAAKRSGSRRSRPAKSTRRKTQSKKTPRRTMSKKQRTIFNHLMSGGTIDDAANES